MLSNTTVRRRASSAMHSPSLYADVTIEIFLRAAGTGLVMRAVPFEGLIGASIEGFQFAAIDKAYTAIRSLSAIKVLRPAILSERVSGTPSVPACAPVPISGTRYCSFEGRLGHQGFVHPAAFLFSRLCSVALTKSESGVGSQRRSPPACW